MAGDQEDALVWTTAKLHDLNGNLDLTEGNTGSAGASGDHRTEHHTSMLRDLERACEWIGMAKGRSKQYQGLIREFWEGEPRRREHILVHNQAFEIIDIFRLWEGKVRSFKGLRERIAKTFDSGPILTEDESISPTSNSNRARNDAFVFYVAGQLLDAGINVVSVEDCGLPGATLQGRGDITFIWENQRIDWQCKRPQSLDAVARRLKEARRQIQKGSDTNCGGIIALDCSVFIRPPGTLIEKSSSSEAADFYRPRMENLLKDRLT
jgi:hypothetical protein